MRFLALAVLLLASPAFADNLIVQKKVTALETTDKVTKMDVAMRVPEVLSCFDRTQTVIVQVTSKAGAVTSTSDAKKKSTDTCLQKQFATMRANGSFRATVQLVVKQDPRHASS
ncbi:MAG TPA: hypothetical protein VLB44_27230 [Kofleriaceae bacterium]|nr:hypothetical protein [Kofleriaceae bacterium]